MKLSQIPVNVQKFIRADRWPNGALELPRFQAHRGVKVGIQGNSIKENSLQAFREAKARGALMVECDVRLSKDRVPVIYHDENLWRLENRSESVSELTAKELWEIAEAPSLANLLEDASCPRLINIEIKSKEILGNSLERRIAEVVEGLGAQNRVMISSFNPFSLFRITGFLPQVPRALLVSTSDDPDNSEILRGMFLAPLISIHMLNLEQTMIDELSLSNWLDQKIPISSWTVNDTELIKRHLKWGVKSVISDLAPDKILN